MTSSPARKIAFLFPGQGSQAAGMGRELAERFPIARQTFDQADHALAFSLSTLCFDGPDDQLKLTEHTQPAILTVSVAAARVLADLGVTPAIAAGHSLGEYSAHVAAGTLTFEDAVRTVRNRGRYMQQAVPPGIGAMAAILGMPAENVAEICRAAAQETNAVVSPANMNSPEQIVISGSKAAVERAADLAKAAGAKRAVMLPVSAPFHCSLMQPAEDNLARDLAHTNFAGPRIPVICNVDARAVTSADDARATLIRQVTAPVRWVECIHALQSAGATHYIEVGPGRVLTGLLRQIDRALSANASNVEDSASLDKTLAALNT
jgi:[acyl-carrier-protein] S-malonyltransferase